MKGYHKTKSGKMAKKGLYYNINQKKNLALQKLKLKVQLLKRHIRICYLGLKNKTKVLGNKLLKLLPQRLFWRPESFLVSFHFY